MRLYAGYAASAIERDRLLDEVTARNRALETIREVLETLAGPVPMADGLGPALKSLRRGLQADDVALLTRKLRGPAEPPLTDGPAAIPASAGAHARGRRLLSAAVDPSLSAGPGRRSEPVQPPGERPPWSSRFRTGRPAAWSHVEGGPLPADSSALCGGRGPLAAGWLSSGKSRFATRRPPLRRSRELQRGFLTRLSHELRTPLTAIGGYASSLMQPDVTWDRVPTAVPDPHRRRVGPARPSGRRPADFSAIESGDLRLQRDWCDLPLVIDAASPAFPAGRAGRGRAGPAARHLGGPRPSGAGLLNLLDNALGHNPAGPGSGSAASAGRGGVRWR